MTHDRDSFEDPVLRRDLQQALGRVAAPRHLVEAVREAAVHMPRSAPRSATYPTEIWSPLLGLGLVVALLIGAVKYLGFSGAGSVAVGTPGVLAGVLVPVVILVLVEVARGAPTLRALVR